MADKVDVLAVLNWQVRQAENRCDTARTMRGADARVKERDDLREARAAVAELIEAADGVGATHGPMLNPRAVTPKQRQLALNRLRAALHRVGGAA